MSVRSKLSISASIAALLLAGSAFAQQSTPIEVTTTVQKEIVVETDDGKQETKLVAAETVVPGERVVYTISFRNAGHEPAGNVVITNPIANTLTYVAGSAAGDDLEVEFSVDGGKSFARASQLTVLDDGVERPATTMDYTHVRWVMQSELAAGGEGQATFAAVLE
ncbi:MAG TPA: hypothetical protein PKK10_18185 [Woeseiaceae bacterium]|nr:hypothetical protein [Woeseiaceae bacterium]